MIKAIIDDNQKCDLCKGSLTFGDSFTDASVPRLGGSWAWLCEVCAVMERVRYGTGLGQRYDSETKNKIEG